MKQTYALLLCVFVYSIANAQVKKGDIVLGGNLYFDNQAASGQTAPQSTAKSNSLTINPSIGKAIRDNLVLGINLEYTHGTYHEIDNGAPAVDQTSNGGMLGVFLRRYKPIGAGFSLFGQAELSGNYSHSNTDQPGTSGNLTHGDSYGFELQFYPGIAYALNRRWQIETSLPNFFLIDYNHSQSTQQYTGQPAQTGTNHDFGISSSLTGNDEFTVGVRYFIGG